MVEQRWWMARILLAATKYASWPNVDRTAPAVVADGLASAYSLCLERLPAVVKGRRKEPKQAFPNWGEAGAELLQVLRRTPPCQDELLATQLSNTMGLAASASLASVATARELTRALLLDPKWALDALPCPGCVVWAPPDQSCLGRRLAGFTQHTAESRTPRSLRPVESFPGCSQIKDLMDLWSHALLLEKHRGMVKKALVTQQWMEVIMPSFGPAPTAATKVVLIACLSAGLT